MGDPDPPLISSSHDHNLTNAPDPLMNNVPQFDGNISLNSSVSSLADMNDLPTIDRISAASSLPVIATYNMRSLEPKLESLKADILERSVDVAFLQEIWEKEGNQNFESKVEKMMEINGMLYFSTPRLLDSRGYAYGGATIIVNSCNYEAQKCQSQLHLVLKFHGA